MENVNNNQEVKITSKIFSYDNSDSPVSFDAENIILFYRFLNPKIDKFRLPKAHLITPKEFNRDTLKYSLLIAAVLFACNFKLDLSFAQWISVLAICILAVICSQLYGLGLYLTHKHQCKDYLEWRNYLKRKGITYDYQVKAALDFEDREGTLNDYITNKVHKHQLRSYLLFVVVLLSLAIFSQVVLLKYMASDSTRNQNLGYFASDKILGTVTSSELSFGDYKVNVNYLNTEGKTVDTYYRTSSELAVGDLVTLANLEHGNAARPVLITSMPKYTLFCILLDFAGLAFSFISFFQNYWKRRSN